MGEAPRFPALEDLAQVSLGPERGRSDMGQSIRIFKVRFPQIVFVGECLPEAIHERSRAKELGR